MSTRAKTSPSGAELLEQVWGLINEHRSLRREATRSPAVKDLRAREKSLRPADAIAATEAWIERHRAALIVHRGEPGEHLPSIQAEVESVGRTALPALHPLHLALIEHFGFLEVAIAPEHWPHRRHRDGLRVFGCAADYPACHLPTQLHAHAARCADSEMASKGEKAKLAKVAKLAPLLGSLEGIIDAWVGGTRSLVEIRDYAHDRDGTAFGSNFYWEQPADPRWGASFAFIARLFLLEQRLENVARLKHLEAICRQVEDVRFDPLLRLRPLRDPRIVISLDRYGYPDRPAFISRQLARGPRGSGVADDPLMVKRAADLQTRTRQVAVAVDHHDLVARVELPTTTFSAADVTRALAVLDHVARMHEDPELLDYGGG